MNVEHEAKMIINGVELTPQQASVVRVALSTFISTIADKDMAHDLGEIGESYQSHTAEVLAIIWGNGH